MTHIYVEGIPIPQGSKVPGVTKLGRPYLRDVDPAALKAWRHKIACAADIGETYDCPVYVNLVFWMPEPKRPKFTYPAVKPDIDKLARAVLDGLKDGGLLSDDARVVSLFVEEYYARSTEPGVSIEVYEL